MLSYLQSKARKAGYAARIVGDTVVIRLPMSVFGHDKSYALVRVKNFNEYNALIGGN